MKPTETPSDYALFSIARLAQRRAWRNRLRRLRKTQDARSEPPQLSLTPARSARQKIGDAFETQALLLLRRHGYRLLGRQLGCPAGEIDLAVEKDGILVFVEVRARSSQDFGGAAASVSAGKQNRILQAASWWLPKLARKHFKGVEPRCRIDVIAFEAGQPIWCQDAVRTGQDK